jgi:hypothetical protein
MRVEVQLEPDHVQNILEGILGANYMYWSWWRSKEYSGNYEWDVHPKDIEEKFVTVEIVSPEHYDVYIEDGEEENTVKKSLSVRDIIESWSKCSALGYEVRHEDSGSADSIMQMAVFGEVIYG